LNYAWTTIGKPHPLWPMQKKNSPLSPFFLFHIICEFNTWWLWLHQGEIIHALQWVRWE
jgi:hypothetical protein